MRQRRHVGRAAVVVLSLSLVVPAGQAAVARAQPSEDAVAAAFAAALRLYEAVPGPCAPDDMPGGPPRITPGDQGLGIPPAQWRQSAEQGIATFLIQLCGLTSARIALGRTPTGDWGLLRGGPAGPAPVFVLPGEMVVCAGGRGVNLHALPGADAAVLAVLPDGSRVTAVAFVLTEPATVGESADGAGWYRLSAPQDGWAYSEFLFDPETGGCPPGSAVSSAPPAQAAVAPPATPVGDRPAPRRIGVADDGGAAAIAAAERLTGGTLGECTATNPPRTVRLQTDERFVDVSFEAWQEAAARGIAVFNVLSCLDSGERLVLGRMHGGTWGFWAGGSARVVQRYVLPGDMFVCADGAGLSLRAAPDFHAPMLAVLPDGTPVTGEEFVLTEPGTYPDVAGAGWYRLSAPQPGWVYSRFLLDARAPDCSLLPLVP